MNTACPEYRGIRNRTLITQLAPACPEFRESSGDGTDEHNLSLPVPNFGNKSGDL